MAIVDTQQGATITFGTGGTFNVVSIGRVGQEIPSIDTTHLGTTGQRTMMPGDLETLQAIQVTVQNDPTLADPTLGSVDTQTITGPLPPGGATSEIYAGTGFVTKVEASDFNAGAEALQTKVFTLQYDGGDNSGTALTRTAATLT